MVQFIVLYHHFPNGTAFKPICRIYITPAEIFVFYSLFFSYSVFFHLLNPHFYRNLRPNLLMVLSAIRLRTLPISFPSYFYLLGSTTFFPLDLPELPSVVSFVVRFLIDVHTIFPDLSVLLPKCLNMPGLTSILLREKVILLIYCYNPIFEKKYMTHHKPLILWYANLVYTIILLSDSTYSQK